MSLINAFWRSFDLQESTLDEHFSEFASNLSTEDADAIRTNIVTKLVEYFAHMVEDIHQAEEAEGSSLSPIGKIFTYFTDDCLQLEEGTKELLRGSFEKSSEEFEDDGDDCDCHDDDDDDDDDDYKVKRFLKALVNITPGPDKDYIDFDQDTDTPDIYDNRWAGGVKVFDRKANRYGHGPSTKRDVLSAEGTDVLINPTVKSQQRASETDAGEYPLKGSTAAAQTLRPNSKPSYSIDLSVAHHAVPGLQQYCDHNDIAAAHVGMGPGVQHFGFQDEDGRNQAARYLKQIFGRTSFKPFTRHQNESKALKVTSPMAESIAYGTETLSHNRLIEEALKHMRKTSAKPSSYSDGAMAGVRNQIAASSKVAAENPLFENDTSPDIQFLEKLGDKRTR